MSAPSCAARTMTQDPMTRNPLTPRRNPPRSTPPSAAPPAVAPQEDPIDTRPTTVMRPADPPPDSDDSGPPSLRHGAPPSRRPAPVTSVEIKPTAPATAPKPADAAPSTIAVLTQPNDDSVIEKARDVAAQFSGNLPNFFCQQVTTRYESDHPKRAGTLSTSSPRTSPMRTAARVTKTSRSETRP